MKQEKEMKKTAKMINNNKNKSNLLGKVRMVDLAIIHYQLFKKKNLRKKRIAKTKQRR